MAAKVALAGAVLALGGLLAAGCAAATRPSTSQARPARVVVTVTVTETRTVIRYRKHHHPPAAAPTPAPATSPAAPAVSLGCKILRQGSGAEEFNVTTVGGGTYSGAISVSFYDYAGSGDVFPGTTVYGATPVGSWQPVPAADIGGSAEPSGCIASVG